MPHLPATTPPPATTPRHKRIIDVHVLLIEGDNVLMALRQGTGYADGQWNVPSGHLEDEEHTAAGAAREVAEEIGVTVDLEDLTLVHVIDHRGSLAAAPRLGLFFTATRWTGTAVNAEPRKCGGIAWYPLAAPPADTVAYHAAAMAHIVAGRPHSVHGWADA